MLISNRRIRRHVLALCASAAICLPLSGQEFFRSGSLKTFIAVGDSLTAGSQNVGLEQSGQVNSYAAVIARQAGVKFNLPLIAAPGEPTTIKLIQNGPFPLLSPIPPFPQQPPPPAPPVFPPPVARIDSPLASPDNLAVPSFTLANALEYRPDATKPALFGDRGPLILGIPGPFVNPPRNYAIQPCLGQPASPECVGKTMIEQAVAKKPTMTLVWLGNNDALIPALFGNLGLLTPLDKFKSDFAKVLKALDDTGSDLVVGTIPYVTQTPYVTSALELAFEYRISLQRLQSETGVGPRDFVRRSALPGIDAILRRTVPGPLPATCSQAGTFYVVELAAPNMVPCILRAADADALNDRTRDYNRIIEDETAKVRGLLVDTNALVTWVNTFGYVVGRERLTTRFLGGLFSLDGVHPSNTGYAIIGNYFIEHMNRRFRLNIRPVNVEAVWQADPLRQYADTLPANILCLLGFCESGNN